jgi:hypothetical protein
VAPGKKHCNGVRVDGANVLRKCLKKTNKKASSSFNLLQNPVGHWMVCVWWWSRSTIAGRVVVSLASKNALKLAAILETPLLTFVGLGLSERMCYLIVLTKQTNKQTNKQRSIADRAPGQIERKSSGSQINHGQ